ncbi:MAG: hypothetical protein ACE5JL_11115, partial [Dehalococcoidia bacterium]
MELKLKALSDYANVSSDGKLNIIGVFDSINPKTLPAILPHMYLVLVYDAAAAEAGVKRNVRIILADADGNQMLSLEQPIVVPQPPRPGARAEVKQILGLNAVKFNKSGDYQFSVLVG